MIPLVSALLKHLRYKAMRLTRTGLLPLIVPFLLLVLTGTFAYARLEGWSLIESLYVTIITITTVGYGDVVPKTPEGRIFAIFFTLVSIGLAGYAISAVAAILFEGQQARIQQRILERRMSKITELSDHIIVCGGGVLGNRAAKEFGRRNTQYVIIEADEPALKRALLWLHEEYVDKRLRHYTHLDEVDLAIDERKSIDQLAEETGVLYLLDDPTDEQVLRTAGVHKAQGVVAAMIDDRDNTTIILSARDMGRRLGNSKLRIVASAQDEMNIHTLYLAGADRVISPNMMGGFSVATQMLDPDAAEFWDQMMFHFDRQMRFGDIKLNDYPEMVGRTTLECKKTLGQLVVAIRRNGEFIYAPDPDETLLADDTLIVMGPHL